MTPPVGDEVDAPADPRRAASLLGRIAPRSAFFRHVAVLAGGTAMAQGLGLLAAPVLTRLYVPAEFGLLAVFTAAVSLLLAVAALRYEMAIPLPEDDGVAVNLLALSLGIVVVLSLACGAAVFTFGGVLERWPSFAALRPYLWLLPLSLAGAGAHQALSYWAVRKRAFSSIARTRLGQSAAQIATQLGLGVLGVGPLGLLVGDAVGRASGSGTLLVRARRDTPGLFRAVSLRRIREAADRYRRFPILSSPSALLNAAGHQLPAILLTAGYGIQAAGWFALGQRVTAVPVMMVGNAFAQVYLEKASRLASRDPEGLRDLFRVSSRQLFLVALPPALFLAAGGPWLFGVVFGERWVEAGGFVRWLTPMLVAQFVVSPLSHTVFVLERQGLQLGWDAARVVVVSAALVAAPLAGLSVSMAVALYSAAMVATYAWLLMLYRGALTRHIRGAE